MEGAASPPPPPFSLERGASLRAVLDVAGFGAAGVREALGADRDLTSERIAHDHRLAHAPPLLAGLIRLLVLSQDVAATVLEPCLEVLVACGVAAVDGDLARGLARIVPHDHLLVASDRPGAGGSDHVAAVHRPSAALASLTVRRSVARAADIGTGNGVQALLCASHCERIVACDINERALAFGEFNAALNGISNVEFRAGSFFEPVEGERFDLVVCNPPYVISPESSVVFRDSGLPGDTVSRRLVEQLPSFLADGAFATIMISWIADEDETARVRSWVDGNGCDAWLIHTASDDPLTAALSWNKAAGSDRIDEWLAYYERLGIERIAYGGLVLRRRGRADSGGWFRSDVLPAKTLEPSSALLERMFAADVDGILDRPLALAPSVVVERSARLENGRWLFEAASIELREGIGWGVNLDTVGAALVDLLDGSAPLRPRLPAVAQQLGIDAAQLEPFAERLVRHLVEHGFTQ